MVAASFNGNWIIDIVRDWFWIMILTRRGRVTLMELVVLLDWATAYQEKRRRRRNRRCGRVGQPQVVFALAAHPVRIGRSVVPLDSHPAVVAQVTDNAPFSRRITVLITSNEYNMHKLYNGSTISIGLNSHQMRHIKSVRRLVLLAEGPRYSWVDERNQWNIKEDF